MQYNIIRTLFVLAILYPGILMADTIHVPTDQPTIQAGINSATVGDTVLVADGTYTGNGNRDIDFLGKSIVVKSENGPSSCLINCQGSEQENHRGFYFHSFETSASIVQGFTIRNGYAPGGGGILCSESSPTIKGNIIRGNTSVGEHFAEGGGIHCYNSSATITNNIIRQNSAEGGSISSLGGGIFFSSCPPNTPAIVNNRIIGNSAEHGGGISFNDASPIITSNSIVGNDAVQNGGGISFKNNADGQFYYNYIMRNTAGAHGGGVAFGLNSAPLFLGNIITENTAGSLGGGVAFRDGATPVFDNNTISMNTAGNGGGGMSLSNTGLSIVTNMILWQNNGPLGGEIYIGASRDSSILTISYSDVEGGLEEVYVDPGAIINWEAGMIDEDPIFVDPSDDDYGLAADSPCIDAGDATYDVPRGGACVIDIGALEFYQGIDCDKLPMQWE